MRGLNWSAGARAFGAAAHTARGQRHSVRTTALTLLVILGLLPAAAQPIEWQTENVDDGADLGSMTGQNIGVTSDGTRHVFLGSNRLRHLWHDASSWQMEVVDPSPHAGGWASMKVDTNDHLHVAYYESGAKDLRYAHFDGSTWGSAWSTVREMWAATAPLAWIRLADHISSTGIHPRVRSATRSWAGQHGR